MKNGKLWTLAPLWNPLCQRDIVTLVHLARQLQLTGSLPELLPELKTKEHVDLAGLFPLPDLWKDSTSSRMEIYYPFLNKSWLIVLLPPVTKDVMVVWWTTLSSGSSTTVVSQPKRTTHTLLVIPVLLELVCPRSPPLPSSILDTLMYPRTVQLASLPPSPNNQFQLPLKPIAHNSNHIPVVFSMTQLIAELH